MKEIKLEREDLQGAYKTMGFCSDMAVSKLACKNTLGIYRKRCMFDNKKRKIFLYKIEFEKEFFSLRINKIQAIITLGETLYQQNA